MSGLGMGTEGFFGPEATIRKVLGSPPVAIHCGLVNALTLSVDPLWLAAFLQHDGWDRDHAVLSLLTAAKADDAMVFGDRKRASAEATILKRLYEPIQGSLERAAGPHPAGTRYRASGAGAQRLFFAARFDAYVRAYELAVGPLPRDGRAKLWADLRVLAELSELASPNDLPSSLGDVEEFIGELLDQALGLDEHWPVVRATVLTPSSRRSVQAVQHAATGIVDQRVRDAWQIPWTEADKRWLQHQSSRVRWISRQAPLSPSTAIYERVERRIRMRRPTGRSV